MFILYYFEEAEDWGELYFELLKASADREKLEDYQKGLEEKTLAYKTALDSYHMAYKARYAKYQTLVKDFLLRNINAIKHGVPENYKKYLSPEELAGLITEDINAKIEYVSRHCPYVFYKDPACKTDYGFLSTILDINKLGEPLLQIEEWKDRVKPPDMPRDYYPENSLYIKEIEEL